MNPLLQRLQPYPFERLRALYAGITPGAAKAPINLSIGEPRHPTPPFIVEALARGAATGLANYPMTRGAPRLREAIAGWLQRRHAPARVDAETEVLPVLGSREALFAFAQVIVDASRSGALVVVPNPFYQIYEGAALLAGVDAHCVNADPAAGFRHPWHAVADDVWARTQLVYVCSPDNPTGNVLGLDDWRTLFELADRHGFVIASDECYSEIYFKQDPPLGGLEAARKLGRDYRNLIAFSSLSKRSNVPGMRSGFVAGDAAILKKFLLYRTYHGGAMSPVIQAASVDAWKDETHVQDNIAKYVTKFSQVTPLLQEVLDVALPDAAFYLWAKVDKLVAISDTEFARRLYAEYNVTVLPGSYLAREAHGVNPGAGRIRMALVAEVEECLEAAQRIVAFTKKLAGQG